MLFRSGAFDAEKIAFIAYNEIHDIFYLNDFNWNVTPSNHETKEFLQVYQKVKSNIENNSLLFFFGKDNHELAEFTKANFIVGKSETSKIQIDKNNFMVIYNKWLNDVKPTIAVYWEEAKKVGIIDGDFYLADLLSQENESIKENLYVLLKTDKYELARKLNNLGMFDNQTARFNDKQKAHSQFWNKYERPPKEQYWDYVVARRDLLVPQDVRERKGSFFTPQIWVELSQKYLTNTLGKHWQDEYYIWDCAAGTGNLLAGLTNKHKIWASTLDRQDVDVMQDRIKNGANLLEDQVFQFDFLNDDFSKLPKKLFDIINNPEKRKKLVIYINPPYAEAATADRQGNKQGLSTTKAKEKYSTLIGNSANEIFAQFSAIIYDKIPDTFLAQFSTLKIIQAPNFSKFRNFFKAEFQKGFIVRANTFDNVKGNFPISFAIWDLRNKIPIQEAEFDIIDNAGNFVGKKKFISSNKDFINDWYKLFYDNKGVEIGVLNTRGNDFQNQNYIYISTENNFNHTSIITKNNLVYACIYFAVRKCIPANWLNDRDQFLYPKNGWETDTEFQHNCLAYSLFCNNIEFKDGANHWIPFTEQELNARAEFESNFMTDFISGKIKKEQPSEMFNKEEISKKIKLEFSPEAQTVFEAGKALWQYYHATINKIPLSSLEKGAVDASLYDIKVYFQGKNEKRMNNNSTDETYKELIAELKEKLKILAKKIEEKVYEYGFLKR